MDLADLTLATFEPLVGATFTVTAPDGAPLPFVLSAASPIGPRPGGRDPFRLLFEGPREPIFPQAIYGFEHATTGVLEIFVVPLGQGTDGTRYEAIFT